MKGSEFMFVSFTMNVIKHFHNIFSVKLDANANIMNF